ncbi:MAG TPA: ribosome maturation factor RimM [Terriglobales bacterium]|nr:ribosome maturation factor RimM [Terriglobales bacterium]
MHSSGEFVTLARVVKTQGRHGEVAVEVHTDVPERFAPGLKLLALPEQGARRELLVEEFWPHKDWLILKFAGVDSISEAETLLRCELQVPSSERGKLKEGWTFTSDLIGCVVYDSDREIGQVKDVRFGAGEAPLLVVTAQSKEYEIPYAEAYLQSVDLEKKRIVMTLPEGLLEVNAPLKHEEKNQEKRKR